MPTNDVQKVVEQDDEERVFKIPGEIEAEKSRLKRSPPKTLDSLNQVITGTIMPIMMEMAHYLKENAQLSYELLDRIEGGGEDTQLTPEHAAKFELVATYAMGIAKASLESGEIASGTDAHQKLVQILATAEECMKIIEESTLTDEGDDGDSDGAEAGSVEEN